ncbi:hypothetical protein [Psychrobacter sanguinis]|uniref:hypothetical protein n=1 Tax=Psychrobacter sanguinis TaxID=861445 RepID=UPI00020C93D5|nr:hypothetical protein [Psychrobacter sanguinis]EGK14179.1 hypothetical protein HMPREF9373_0955 [Psychrobacter sp. 1501(2011)]MCD9150660.1 hypothetical protein [Psychrobacter sanguinis]
MSLTRLLSNKIAAGRAVRLTTIMFAAAFTLTACGGGEHEVKAVDKLDEAAELAKANAPEHEFLAPEDIAPAAAAPAPDAAAAGTDAATDGATATDPAAGEATATGTTTEAPAMDATASTAAPAEATTATDATAAQPADQKEAAAQ